MTSDSQPRFRRITLIDVTVICAALVTVALILTPSLADIVNDARVARAQSDCNALASTVSRFHGDAGLFPRWEHGGPDHPAEPRERLVLLAGAGNIPGGETGNRALQGWLLPSSEVTSCAFAPIGPDPWNNRYMVNVGASASGGRESAIFAISAGPNGIVETPFSQPIAAASLAGDDIGQRIR